MPLRKPKIRFVMLLTAGLSCALAEARPKVYWTDLTAKIRRCNLDGSNVEDLVTSGVAGPAGIALDLAAGKMYWADSWVGKIQRAKLDGTNIEDVVSTGLVIPFGIALDLDAGRMYWTDSGLGKVLRANLDGSGIEDVAVVTGTSQLAGIALDTSAGKVYWTDMFNHTIHRASLNGSDVEELVTFATSGLDEPSSIALDPAANRMYWTGGDHVPRIQRSNLDGTDIEDVVVVGLTNVFGIAFDVDAGKMYWADAGLLYDDTGTIERANLGGSHVQELVNSLSGPLEIALDLRAPPGDCDRDGTVTLEDHRSFTSCAGGPGSQRAAACGCADVNGNGSIDLVDFALLQAAFNDS